MRSAVYRDALCRCSAFAETSMWFRAVGWKNFFWKARKGVDNASGKGYTRGDWNESLRWAFRTRAYMAYYADTS